MELSRREVPLYGQVQTAAVLQDPVSASEEAEFYVLLQGSLLIHVTVARRTSDALSLCFMLPGHDQPERVCVSVYCVSEGTLKPCGGPTSVEYVRDVAQDIAEYLSANRDHLNPQSCLEVLRRLSSKREDHVRVSNGGHDEQVIGDCNNHEEEEERSSGEPQDAAGVLGELDQNIALALANMEEFPHHHQWRNTQHQGAAETAVSWLQPRESVLHLAVRLGLRHLSRFLIHQPGGQRLLALPNEEGDTPLQLAQGMGQHDLFTVLGRPPERAGGHGADVRCVWSDGSGSTLRFWPGTDSLSLTLPSDPEGLRPEDSITLLRDRLKDHHVLRQITAFRGPTKMEGSDHTHANDADPSEELCAEERGLVDNVFEEHLVLSLDEDEDDDDVCEELQSFLPESQCPASPRGVQSRPPPSAGVDVMSLMDSVDHQRDHQAITDTTTQLTQVDDGDVTVCHLSGVTGDSTGMDGVDSDDVLLVTDTPPPPPPCHFLSESPPPPPQPCHFLSESPPPPPPPPSDFQSGPSRSPSPPPPASPVRQSACLSPAVQALGRLNDRRMSHPPHLDLTNPRESSPSPENDGLSPSLVAVEVDSDDDEEGAVSPPPLSPLSPLCPKSPDSPNSADERDSHEASRDDLACMRTLSASSACDLIPSKDSADPGIRLRSYSYSSPKISLRPRRRMALQDATATPPPELSPDGVFHGLSHSRPLLQALSLSKSLSLLHPAKQRVASLSEQPHEKREIRLRKRAQSADDDSNVELAESLQHLTLSEFLKEIEEEAFDRYSSPSKAESEKYKVIRTFSFLKSRMSSTRNKNKGKGKQREAKDRQLNGHRFTSGSVMGPSVCVICDKPAHGKELLHCTSCTAMVHKACKEYAPPCMKDKYAVTKSRTASLPQNFTVRDSSAQCVVPTSPSLPVITAKERKDSSPLLTSTCRSFHNDRFNETSETECDGWRIPGQSDELQHIMDSSTSTDSSLGEDCIDAGLHGDLTSDAAEYEAESWSLAVQPGFCETLPKREVKRQDVIYELMQTELHHLQTLRVMAEVFRRGARDQVQLDADALERLFPRLDQLLLFHTAFYTAMKERRHGSSTHSPGHCSTQEHCLTQTQALSSAQTPGPCSPSNPPLCSTQTPAPEPCCCSTQPPGHANYLIQHIGDVLLQQFSDENADRMKQVYGEFCSHHNEAVNFFKELQHNNKRFQHFIKQQSNNSLVRRREIPECILLVTQRITKYPVLLERILQYTQEDTEEHADMVRALALVREVIAAVDLRVSEYEQDQRLQEVLSRMENRSSAKLKNGLAFRKQDLTGQTLRHQGLLLWKTATGRLKDVLVLLLSDSLIFLQEKDQKYTFATVDQKPPVVSLQKLIVREVANEERGMFLISASAAGPEMYEVHTSAKDERNTWMRLIREAVESCPEEEEDSSEPEEEKRAADARMHKIHKLQESLISSDQQICQSLEEKLQMYAELFALRMDPPSPRACRLLVQPCSEEPPRATLLLAAAMQEADDLRATLRSGGCSKGGCDPSSHTESRVPVTPSHHDAMSPADPHEDPALQSLTHCQHGDPSSVHLKVAQSVQNLTQLLYSLQAAVTIQDTCYEVQRLLAQESERGPRPHHPLLEQEKQRSLEKRREEVASVRRLQGRLHQERQRWQKESQARTDQQREQESRLEERERQCHLEAERLRRDKEELEQQLEEYQLSLERLREGQRSVEKERHRLETQHRLLHSWRHGRQRSLPSSVAPAMVIPLDGQQDLVSGRRAADDDGSVFVNEAALAGSAALNNRHHLHHTGSDPTAHNSLNTLLARSNHRGSCSADPHGWTGILCTPTGTLGDRDIHSAVRRAWSSPAATAAAADQNPGLPPGRRDPPLHLSVPVSMATEFGEEEESQEENIVFL